MQVIGSDRTCCLEQTHPCHDVSVAAGMIVNPCETTERAVSALNKKDEPPDNMPKTAVPQRIVQYDAAGSQARLEEADSRVGVRSQQELLEKPSLFLQGHVEPGVMLARELDFSVTLRPP